jgi:hypothetical protein
MRKSHKKALYSIPGWEEFVSNDLRQFLPFEEAREFARNLKLNGQPDWRKWSKSDKRPDNIPSSPSRTYKDSGWIGWGDFLGTGNIATYNREYRSFEEVKKITHKLKLNGQADWQKWCKSEEKTDDIPFTPNTVYEDSGWISWGDFLGTGNIATIDKKFRSFEDAREFARNLKLNGQADWFDWCKSVGRPDNIPSSPSRTYKDSGWIGWGDFLGTGNIATIDKKFRSFEDAREFARNLKLNGQAAWFKWSKSGKKPDDIPSGPNTTYKDSGWISWGDFLGTGNIASQNRNFLPFKEARKFARNLNLSGQAAWVEWCKSGNKPDNIPQKPSRTYKDSGWVRYGDWLGTGNISNQNREFLPFEEARTFARNLNLNGRTTWREWCKSGERPDNIPSNPNSVYKDSGWIGMGDFLGTGNTAPKDRNFLVFEEARKFVRNLKLRGEANWRKWCKSGNRPDDIPSDPYTVYKNSGWVGMADWLGKS